MTPRTLLTVTLLASLGQAAPPAEIAPLPRPEPSARQLLEPVPFLRAPFDGEFKVTSFFDHRHETPKKDEKRQTSFWGAPTHGHTGHHGYDWSMPEGTPLLAVADGVVESAGHEPPFNCYINGEVVDDQLSVILQHQGPDGKIYQSRYTHLSSAVVTPGQTVKAGQTVALSGNSGCSSGTHLHFEVMTQVPPNNVMRKIDPFGWEGPGTDPRSMHRYGAQSTWLWLPGQAPPLARERSRVAGRVPLQIIYLRSMGVNDLYTPNNEVAQIIYNRERGAPRVLELSEYQLENNGGDVVPLPAYRLPAGSTVAVYTGSGSPGPGVVYLEHHRDLWDDTGDCAWLVRTSDGFVMSKMSVGRDKEQLCNEPSRRDRQVFLGR